MDDSPRVRATIRQVNPAAASEARAEAYVAKTDLRVLRSLLTEG